MFFFCQFDTFVDEETLYANDYQLDEENQCGFGQLYSNSSRTAMSDYPLGLHFPQQSYRRCRESLFDVVRHTHS